MLYNARWYVYQLIDPRDGQTFYIGKGTGKRCFQHEKDALKGVCSAKCQRIRDIRNCGLYIITEKVAEFWDEAAAYECEAERIAEAWDSLTNVVQGGGGSWSVERMAKPRELTPVSALFTLQRRLDLVADFLIKTDGGKRKVKVEIAGPVNSVWKKIWEGCLNLAYNKLYMDCIKTVAKSEKEWLSLQESLLHYGVRLENGC